MAVSESSWICTVCGYVHTGPEAPEFCPVCGATQDLFEPHVETVAEEKTPPQQWRCLNCEYIHDGIHAPEFCPVCGATPDRFEPYIEEKAISSHSTTKEKVVIVGAGIAGISAAEAFRKYSPESEIVLLSKEDFLPYYRLNLTRYLADDVTLDELPIHPEKWYSDKNIDLILNTELTHIDLDGKKLTVRNGDDVSFDKLILTVGSHPFVPPLTGTNKENVTVLRTIKHAETIIDFCKPGMKCVCIGGGLLGLETAGALSKRGADVSLLEGFGWLLPRQLNKAAAMILENFVTAKGIHLIKNTRTEEIVGDEHVHGVRLQDGSTLPADLVVIATGVRTNSYLARMVGLEVNRGIIVDHHLKTSHPDVYAAGDVAEHRGVTYGIWGPSQFMGTIAGMNGAGEATEFAGIPRTNMLKVLSVDMFSIGQIQPEDASYIIIEEEHEGNYYYFLFRDSHLVGCILLGDTSLSSTVKRIIEKKVDCSKINKASSTLMDVTEFLMMQ